MARPKKIVSSPTLPSGQVELVAISNLVFDPVNPRLPSDIAKGSDEEIIRYMLDQESLIELMRSIAEIGFFPGEPLLVFPDSEGGEKLIVGEGNRRLAALKLLENPSLAKVRSKTVQEIFDKKSKNISYVPIIKYNDREDIIDYLGYRHITGVEEWDPLSKARYLQQLYRRKTEGDHSVKARALARTVGSTAPTVTKILQGIAVVDRLTDLNILGEDFPESKIDFSVLTTALGYQNISDFVGIDNTDPFNSESINEDNLIELSDWILKKQGTGRSARSRIGESRNLGELSKLLEAGGEALEMFRSGTSLEDSIAFTKFPTLDLHDMLGEITNKMRVALDKAQTIKIVDNESKETAAILVRTARSLQQAIDNRLEERRSMGHENGL